MLEEGTPQIAGQKRKNESLDAEKLLLTSSSQDLAPEDSNDSLQGTPSKKKSKPKKPLDSRFGGKTEEEIMELLLPDHLKPNLDIVFVCSKITSLHIDCMYCISIYYALVTHIHA